MKLSRELRSLAKRLDIAEAANDSGQFQRVLSDLLALNARVANEMAKVQVKSVAVNLVDDFFRRLQL